ACILTEYNASIGVGSLQSRTQCAADRKNGCRIKRVLPSDATNAICSEELSISGLRSWTGQLRNSWFLSILFGYHGDANRVGLYRADQGIGNIYVGREACASHHARCVNRIGDRILDHFNALFRTHDFDPLGSDFRFKYAEAGGETAGDTRLDLDLFSRASIEADLQMRGHDLNDFDLVRHVDLPRCEIEGSLARHHARKIDYGMNVFLRHLANHAGGPTHPDLRLWNDLGADNQFFRHVVEFNRNVDGDFR